VEQALAARDQTTLTRYGRFLVPILENMIANERNPSRQARFREYLNSSYAVVAESR
jgi:hypothetical protein